jgi:glycosyltransferase involved in cell wall biosynthesis
MSREHGARNATLGSMLPAPFSLPPMATAAIKPAQAQSGPDQRPGLAIIANVVPPYRRNLHSLIAAGIPEFKLHTLVTHGPAEFAWKLQLPESIHAVYFGSPSDSPLASSLHRPLYEWRKGGRLIEYIQANNIRAVILFGYRYLSYLRVIRYCRRIGLPVFIHNDSNVRGDRDLPAWKRRGKSLVYRWWLGKVSGVFSMGEFGDQFFVKYGAKPHQLYRVPWPLDPAFQQGVEEDRLQRFRRKYGLVAGRRYILFSGRLAPEKRVDLLIDAFAALAARRPEWDLLIVGEGALGEELRGRVPAALQGRVVWTGFLTGEEPRLAFAAADVLVLPSDREPWALVVQEAMAAGLPVIASDVVGAAHELVEDGVSGRIFPVGNRQALEESILQVTAPEAIEAYKERSRAAVVRWQQSVDPIGEIRRALKQSAVIGA